MIPGSERSTGEGIDYPLMYTWASLMAQLVKNLSAMWETWVQSLGWEDLLEKGKATHSSILAWRPGFYPWVGKIPWRRERLPTPVFWPGEFHGLYSPKGRKESDITEQLSLFTFTIIIFLWIIIYDSKEQKSIYVHDLENLVLLVYH